MDEELLRQIHEEYRKNQEEVLLLPLNVAKKLLGGSQDAYGFTAEDVVDEAIRRTLDPNCKRVWNPDKCSLAKYLCGVVRSILSKKDLWKKRDRDPVNFGMLMSDDIHEEAEDSVEKEEHAALLLQAIEETIQGDVELGMYVTAVYEGAESAAEIAQEIGLGVNRVYELKRKLQSRAPKINEKHQELLTQSQP